MTNKLELVWLDKEKRINVEPRILIEQPQLSYKKDFISLLDNTNLTDNVLIHGDNLIGLKALLPNYSGRVKCVFIDPCCGSGGMFVQSAEFIKRHKGNKKWGEEKYKWEAVRWFQDNWDNILNVSDANALEHEKISHTTVKYKTILPIIRF